MIKYKFIDLFAGCGGLEDGFLQSGMYIDVAAVEWLKPQVNTLIQRLKTKWQIADASDRVMHFDIQREEELFKGWKDEEFGRGKGLDYFIIWICSIGLAHTIRTDTFLDMAISAEIMLL